MNKLKATLLVGIAGSLPFFGSTPAQAAMPCAPTYSRTQLIAAGFECSVGDKTYYDFVLPNSTGASTGNPWTSTLFIINAVIPEVHTFQATNIGANVTATAATPLTLTYSYKVKIDPLGAKYLAFTSGATITKTQPSMMQMPVFNGELEATKMPSNMVVGKAMYDEMSMSSGVMIPGNYDGILQFNGKIVLTKNALLTQFTDTLTQTAVPGPLPVVGAAAAFGFSRRLRKRVKAMA